MFAALPSMRLFGLDLRSPWPTDKSIPADSPVRPTPSPDHRRFDNDPREPLARADCTHQ